MASGMRTYPLIGLALSLSSLFLVSTQAASVGRAFYGDPPDATHPWAVHDRNRPQPPVVTPGTDGSAPSDAIVLFDGTGLDGWESTKNGGGGPAAWKVQDGYMEAVRGTGSIRTRGQFGDCQLHLEWAAPSEVKGDSQGRGNSGVFFVGGCEVQILDNYSNPTYADGSAGSIYGIHAPLANSLRPPGEFNVYDIVFRRPIFRDGEEIDPGRVTVFCNGVLVQDSATLEGRGGHRKRTVPTPFPDRGPIQLQDHNNPVRFRNIWIRELPLRISEGGTAGGRLTEDVAASLRAQTAAAIREKAGGERDDFARLLLLMESLTYERDPQTATDVKELLAGYIGDLERASGPMLARMKSGALELNVAVGYLAKHEFFQAPEQRAALEGLIKQQGWDK